MEEVFKQSFEYAEIIRYRNYSRLDGDDRNGIVARMAPRVGKSQGMKVSIDIAPMDVFGCSDENTPIIQTATRYDRVQVMPLFAKDNKHYFHSSPTDIHEETHYTVRGKHLQFVPIPVMMVKETKFETQKQRHIKKNYNNPFAEIAIIKHERWIKRDGDKIIVKFYVGTKHRPFNCYHFIKRTNSTTLTFNLKTGNFTVVTYDGTGKSKVKKFYCNSYLSLKECLGTTIYHPTNKFNASQFLKNKFIQEFNTCEFHEKIGEVLSLRYRPNMDDFDRVSGIDVVKQVYIPDFLRAWITRFAEIKKIKMPNDGLRYIKYYYPTEKYLKKNDRKLIAATLDRIGIKSNITIKIVHENSSIDLLDLVRICRLFGRDYPKYLGNLNIQSFPKQVADNEVHDRYQLNQYIQDRTTIPIHNVNPQEKENIIKILNNSVDYADIVRHHGNLIGSLYDHFRMLDICRVYYPDMRLRARTVEEFSTEHTEVSKIENQLKKGYITEIEYDENVLNELQKPIIVYEWGPKLSATDFEQGLRVEPTTEKYVPVVLTSSIEYGLEGKYMHHCVGSYSDKERSMIISLRHNSERVTIEFDIRTRKPMQSRYFCNGEPPENFKKPLETLYQRVASIPMSLQGKRIKVPLKLDNIVVTNIANPQALLDGPNIMVPNRYIPMEPWVAPAHAELGLIVNDNPFV